MRFLLGLFALLILLIKPQAARAEEPAVGFIWHYPYVDVGTDEIAASGATVMMARASWVYMERDKGHIDLAPLDQQLAAARKGDFKLVLLLECNPFCSPFWLRKECGEAGQNGIGVDGTDSQIPSLTSPLFQQAQQRFLAAVIKHVRRVDRQRNIVQYHAGVEWWFPVEFRYNPADVQRFREWLAVTYGTVKRLNAAWGGDYPGFEQVPPPPFVVMPDLFQRKRQGMAHWVIWGEPPAYGNLDAATSDWNRFWEETSADAMDALARAIKGWDDSRPVASFMTFAWGTVAEWDYRQWAAVGVDEVARRAKALDVLAMQLPLSEGDPHRIEAGLDLARKAGKPMWILDLLDFAAGVHIGYLPMLRATHTAVQHGATGLQYCCWNGAIDFNFYPDWPMDQLRSMVDEGKRAIQLTEGLEPKPDGALIVPVLPASLKDAEGFKNDPASYLGWYKLLRSMQLGIDLVTLRDLEAGLSLKDYPWVVVPDCAVLPKKALAELSDYSGQGGLLITSGRFAERDETGTALATEGLSRKALPDLGAPYWGPLLRDGHAGDTPPQLLWQRTLAQAAPERLAAMRALREAGLAGSVTLLPDSPEVTCMPLTGNQSLGAYLVNHSDEQAKDLLIRLKSPRPEAVEVWCDTARTECLWRFEAGELELHLPPFKTSCLVKAQIRY